jgi:predicted enzyme related to lactoylglutathione lyase
VDRFRANLSLVNASDTASPTASPSQSKERIVQSIAHALAVAPSLGPARSAWMRLGFQCGSDLVYQGCRAFDVDLRDGGIRILRPDAGLPSAPLRELAARQLEIGAGLIGWTWGARDPERTRKVVETVGGARFKLNPDGSKSFVAPDSLTAGAVTLLEQQPAPREVKHPNRADHIDHIVLMVGDADATANVIGQAFHLKPRARDMKESRYAFCKVGETVLEIVGPPRPEKNPAQGRVWGITFGSSDMDRTVSEMRAHGVNMPDPHDAIQGGRIVSVPTPVGGMQIAFMGS